MHIQRQQPRPPVKGLIPFTFDKKNDNEEPDWGMNPNPDGWEPNYPVMGVCAAGGVCGGVSLGFLGSAYLGIPALPLVAACSIAGAYVGGAIGLAIGQRKGS